MIIQGIIFAVPGFNINLFFNCIVSFIYIHGGALTEIQTFNIIVFQSLAGYFLFCFEGDTGNFTKGTNSDEHPLHFLHRMWHCLPHSAQVFTRLIATDKQNTLALPRNYASCNIKLCNT